MSLLHGREFAVDLRKRGIAFSLRERRVQRGAVDLALEIGPISPDILLGGNGSPPLRIVASARP
jgi:hypothetical protein